MPAMLKVDKLIRESPFMGAAAIDGGAVYANASYTYLLSFVGSVRLFSVWPRTWIFGYAFADFFLSLCPCSSSWRRCAFTRLDTRWEFARPSHAAITRLRASSYVICGATRCRVRTAPVWVAQDASSLIRVSTYACSRPPSSASRPRAWGSRRGRTSL